MITIHKSSNTYQKIGNSFYFLTKPLSCRYLKLIKSERTRVILFDTKSNELILVKNWFGNGEYQLPGGGIKKGEETKSAAKREIQEELGIELSFASIKLVKVLNGKFYKKVFMLAYCNLTDTFINSLQIAHHEIVEVIKLKISEIDQLKHKLDKSTYNLLQTLDIQTINGG